MEEEFRIITGYSKYEVSNLGRVRNIKTGRILKAGINGVGYLMVNLNKKSLRIHRLVALMFIDNVFNKSCIDHINNVRTDNRVENLRWATIAENNRNHSLRCNSVTGCKGVTYDDRQDAYVARITFNRERFYLGSFKNLEDAIKVRRQKANELFNDYCNERE